MSSTEASFSVTVKTPKGNLVTVRGDTAADWVAHLTQAGESGALGIIAQIEASLVGQPAPARPAPAAPGPSENWQSTKQPAQELPAGFGVPPCGVCGAPTRFDKEGVSKQSGTPYKRYLCTTDTSHKATFTN